MANLNIAVELAAKVAGAQDIKNFNKNLGDVGTTSRGLKLSLADLKAGLDLAAQAFQQAQAFAKSFIDPTVELATQVRDLSRAIGATPEEASRLIAAADDMGVSVESLERGLLAAIRRGVEPTIEGIGELADQYNAIEDPIARTKFLLDNFGRSGAELGELLEKGSEGIAELGEQAEKLGLVMDEDALAAAKEYELAMDDLNDSITGLKISIGREALPVLNVFAMAATDHVTTLGLFGRGLTDGTLSLKEFGHAASLAAIPTRNRMAAAIEYLTNATADLSTMMRNVAPSLSELGDRDTTGIDRMAEVVGKLADHTQRGADATRALNSAWGELRADEAAGALQATGAGAERYLLGLEAIDRVLGTGLANQESAQRHLEAINAEFARTGDVAAYEAALTRFYTHTLPGAEKALEGVKSQSMQLHDSLGNVLIKMDELDGKVATATIKTVFIEETIRVNSSDKDGSNGTSGVDNKFAGGVTNFIVPPGYPNDSYRVGLTSGEVVNVTPTQNNHFNFHNTFSGQANISQIVAEVSARVAADLRGALRSGAYRMG